MNNNKALLQIEHLKKQYDNDQDVVLDNLNLEVYEEDFLSILGPSGCGKSTLIRCIAGFEEYEGKIMVDGKPVKRPGPDRIMVFQDFNQLFPWKTVLGNITYPLKVGGMKDKAERQKKGEEYLEKVNLLKYKNYFPHQLSGGMKQRVAIARGLALGSRIMLMDEPFAALDAMTRNQMQEELLSIKEREKMTVIFITHNIQEAVILGNRIIVMASNGEIKEHIENKLQRPISPATPGYGQLWEHLHSMLVAESQFHSENIRKKVADE